MPTIPNGIDSLPATQVPTVWSKGWFTGLLLTWLRAADVRNATAGPGITITGKGIIPATISLTIFTSTVQGVVPASGGSATTYLNGAGAFINPLSGGLSVTITTAKLTTSGTQGSMTFTNGILTAQTAAT